MYRVVNLCLTIAGRAELEKIAAAAAFHDLGIWTNGTFDRIAPSIALARDNPKRGPMLIVSADSDQAVRWAISNAAYKKQKRNQSVTEIVKMPHRVIRVRQAIRMIERAIRSTMADQTKRLSWLEHHRHRAASFDLSARTTPLFGTSSFFYQRTPSTDEDHEIVIRRSKGIVDTSV